LSKEADRTLLHSILKLLLHTLPSWQGIWEECC